MGILAVISTFWQVLSGQLKYGAKSDMHTSASLDLKKITDDLSFKQVSRIASTNERNIWVEEVHKMYSQVMLGCKSQAPLQITQAFTTLETRVLMKFKDEYDLLRNNDKQIFMTTATNELYCIISKYWLWPLKLPDSDWLLDETIKRLQLAQEEKARKARAEGDDTPFSRLL